MLTVGQELWVVPNDKRNEPYAAKITKIGRKWADLDRYKMRVDVDTMQLGGERGMSSPAECYLSKEHWAAEMKRRKAWHYVLFRLTPYGVPDGVTMEDIHQIAKLVGIKIEGIEE